MPSRSIFVAVLLAVACRNETPAPAAQQTTEPPASTTVAAPPRDLSGQKVDTTVTIPPVPVTDCAVRPSLNAGEPIDFVMRLSDAPAELQVSVRVMKGEEEVAVVRQAAEGKKVVTLRLPKLKPGKYKLEGIWGGNLGCEQEIEVTK